MYHQNFQIIEVINLNLVETKTIGMTNLIFGILESIKISRDYFNFEFDLLFMV